MIVVDTNVIAYLYLTTGPTRQAELLLQRDAQWAAPRLWRSEFRNVLAQHLRRGLLSLEVAQRIMNRATGLMLGQEYEVVSDEVISLAVKSSCSAYDCEFVALAQDLGVPLVTVDRQVLERFRPVAVSLDEYVESHGAW